MKNTKAPCEDEVVIEMVKLAGGYYQPVDEQTGLLPRP